MFYAPASRARPGARGKLIIGGLLNSGNLPGLQPFLTINQEILTQNIIGLKIIATWKNSSITFDAPLFMNITNTASANGSLLADFQVGGTSLYTFGLGTTSNAGLSINLAGTSANPALWFNPPNGGGVQNGIFITGVGTGSSTLTNFMSGGTIVMSLNGFSLGNGVRLCNNTNIGWLSANDPSNQSNGADTLLYRDAAAGVLALGNGTNAMGFRCYNTTDQNGTNTAPTNFERGIFDFTTNTNKLTIGTQSGGTGSARSIAFAQGGNNTLGIDTSGFRLGSNQSVKWSNASNNAFGSDATDISAVTNGVLVINNDQAGGRGYLQTGGAVRVTVDFSVASSTVMTTSTSAVLSVALQSGRNYSFQACLFSTCSTTGGIAVALQSTTITGSTDLHWHAYTMSQNTIAGEVFSTVLGSSATLGGPVAVLPSTTNVVTYIDGTITNTASAGNLQIWFAQDVSTSVASVVKTGSFIWLQDMP